MIPALLFVLVTLTTQSPTLAMVSTFGYCILRVITRALLLRS